MTTDPGSWNGEASYDGTLREAPVIFVASTQEIKLLSFIEEYPGEERQEVTFAVLPFYKVTLRHPAPAQAM